MRFKIMLRLVFPIIRQNPCSKTSRTNMEDKLSIFKKVSITVWALTLLKNLWEIIA